MEVEEDIPVMDMVEAIGVVNVEVTTKEMDIRVMDIILIEEDINRNEEGIKTKEEVAGATTGSRPEKHALSQYI